MECKKCKKGFGSGYKVLDSVLQDPALNREFYCSRCYNKDKEEFIEKGIANVSLIDEEKYVYNLFCPNCRCNVEKITNDAAKDKRDEEYLKHRQSCQESLTKNSITSLDQFIKEISRQKGRKVKIICDWDGVIQWSNYGYAIYEFMDKKPSIQEFFENYVCKVKEEANKKIIEEGEKISNEEHYEEFLRSPDFYFRAPFLTLADDILELLKEGNVIEELHFLTGVYHEQKTHYERLGLEKGATMAEVKESYQKLSYQWHPEKFSDASEEDRKKAKKEFGNIQESFLVLFDPLKKLYYDDHGEFWEKKVKFQQCFGKFPRTSINWAVWELDKVETYDYSKYHWIAKNCPDFDIIIDDDVNLIENRVGFYSEDNDERKFLIPEYGSNNHARGKEVYFIKNVVSELKDEDFAIATWEKSQKEKTTDNPSNLREQKETFVQIEIPPKANTSWTI